MFLSLECFMGSISYDHSWCLAKFSTFPITACQIINVSRRRELLRRHSHNAILTVNRSSSFRKLTIVISYKLFLQRKQESDLMSEKSAVLIVDDNESINGKAVLNSSFFRGYRFCRSNRSGIGSRKACVEVAYKTTVNFSKSTKSPYNSQKA